MIYTHSICEQGTEIMRTVAEQGRALMIPPGAPDEANELRAALQVIHHKLFKIVGPYIFVNQL